MPNPRFGRLFLLLLAGAACGPDAREKNDCAGKPDFIVRVESKEGMIPDGTRVEVEYGGGSKEPYEIGKSNNPQIMFCDPKRVLIEPSGGGGAAGGSSSGEADAGSGASIIRELVCELWTAGPASLTVRAPGFERVDLSLELQPEECPLEETVELELTRGPK